MKYELETVNIGSSILDRTMIGSGRIGSDWMGWDQEDGGPGEFKMGTAGLEFLRRRESLSYIYP